MDKMQDADIMEEKDKPNVRTITKLKRFYCHVCKLYTNSDEQLNQHLTGLRHHQRLLIFNNEINEVLDRENEWNSFVYVPTLIIFFITIFIFIYLYLNLTKYLNI